MSKKTSQKRNRSDNAKQKMTTSIDAELLDKAKATAWHCGVTLSSIVESSLKKEIARLERKHKVKFEFNDKVALPVGRPLKR